MIEIKGISHLGFNVTDMEKSLDFYCNGFGLKKKCKLNFGAMEDILAKKMLAGVPQEQQEAARANFHEQFKGVADDPWFIYLEAGNGNFIELFYPRKDIRFLENLLEDPTQMIGYNHLSLLVDDIYEAVADLKSRGIEPTSEITHGPDNTYQCWFADPDGNRIELMQYTPQSLQIVGNDC